MGQFVDGITKVKKRVWVIQAAADTKIVFQAGSIASRPARGQSLNPHTVSERGAKSNLLMPIMVAALLLAFLGGVWAALNITPGYAEVQPRILGIQTNKPWPPNNRIPLSSAGGLGPVNTIPNDALFNMTIDQLEVYLAETLKTPETRQAELLVARKEKLVKYLEERNSPLVNIVDTLAGLKHWKIVLAVSNSESSLGKRCYQNNCSGIGVEPGHPLWRSYNNKAEWSIDLDRLLEKRYKNWTLEDMNGVYNQPGSRNWLMAAKQVLEDLQERGID